MESYRTPKSEPYGNLYEFAIIAFLAIEYSKNDQIADYTIRNNFRNAYPFDDVVVKVTLNGTKYLLLLQVKLRSKRKYQKEETKLTKDLCYKSYKTIMNRECELRKDINDENILFGLFSSGDLISTLFENSDTLKESKSDNLWELQNSIDMLVPNNNKWCQYEDKTRSNHANFFKQFYWFSKQPNLETFYNTIGKDIINDIRAFFDESKLHAVGLSKKVFDMNLKAFHLKERNFLFPLSEIEENVSLHEDWNETVLQYDITVVDNATDNKIHRYLFGCIAAKINSILSDTLKWNEYVRNKSKKLDKTIVDEFKKYVNDKERYWVREPRTLESLVLELWKYAVIPIVLGPDNDSNIFNFVWTLKQRCIIVGNFEELVTDGNKVFVDAKNIKTAGQKLLRKLKISPIDGTETNIYDLIAQEIILPQNYTVAKIIEVIQNNQVDMQSNFADHSIRNRTIPQRDAFLKIFGERILTCEQGTTVGHTKFFKDIVNKPGPTMTVITGELGIGKSFLLRRLADLYVHGEEILFFDLLELNNPTSPVSFKKFSSECKNVLKCRNVIVALDSYDKLIEHHKDKVFEFIKSLYQNVNTKNHIILTSRVKDSVSQNITDINIEEFNLKPLEHKLCLEYIETHHSLEVKNELSDEDSEKVISIPLYLLEFLPKIKPNSKFSIYEEFLKLAIKRAGSDLHDQENCKSLFPMLALEAILGRIIRKVQFNKRFNTSYIKQVQEIVTECKENQVIKFRYNVFRDLLCSRLFIIKPSIFTGKQIEQFYEEISDKKKLHALNILSEEKILHKAFIRNYMYEDIVKLCQVKENLESVDKLGRNALHIAGICKTRYDQDNCGTRIDGIIFQLFTLMIKSNSCINKQDTVKKWGWRDYFPAEDTLFQAMNGMECNATCSCRIQHD